LAKGGCTSGAPPITASAAFQVSALIESQALWRISGYAEVKYLYSSHEAIDFSDFGFIVGIGFRAATWY
jgi:hypothetical protein